MYFTPQPLKPGYGPVHNTFHWRVQSLAKLLHVCFLPISVLWLVAWNGR